MVDLPDIRQTEGYDCGMALRASVLQYRGLTDTGCCTASEIDGLSPDVMELILRQAGLPVMAGTMTLDRLRYFTNRESSPVLCPVNHFGGHWIAVVGLDRRWVEFQCPLRGRHSMKLAVFDESWHDVTRRAHTFDHWGIVA